MRQVNRLDFAVPTVLEIIKQSLRLLHLEKEKIPSSFG